jgi:hypothetical protein
MTQPSRIDGLPDLPPGDIGPTDDEFGYSQELVRSIILADRAAQAAKQVAAWQPIETAPKDGTIVRLLVNFTEHPLEDDNEKPIATIGGNCGDNTGEDQWQFAGWSWDQDCFTEGEGEVVGWMPMLDTSAPSATSLASAAEAGQVLATFEDWWYGHDGMRQRQVAYLGWPCTKELAQSIWNDARAALAQHQAPQQGEQQ